jgi:hypothetical protein
MHAALDTYFVHHNERRPHHDRGMKGRTTLKVFKRYIPKPEPKGEKRTTPHLTTATTTQSGSQGETVR